MTLCNHRESILSLVLHRDTNKVGGKIVIFCIYQIMPDYSKIQ